MGRLCDFHVHSTASDGALSPAEVVSAARDAGVGVLALTDHDEVSGIPEARARGAELDVEIVPGIELSVSEAGGTRQMHVLGLGIDCEAPALAARLIEFRETRATRARSILARLEELGIEVGFDEVRAIAGPGIVGRPHIARALVARHICMDEEEAFRRFLRRGRPAFVPREGLTARGAIELIHAAGGVAALAHPTLSIGVDAPGGLAAFVARLVALGLDGLEVQHPQVSAGSRRRVRRLARRHGLLELGGSDFHGEPGETPGRGGVRGGHGSVRVEEEVYTALRERLEERRGRLTPPGRGRTLVRL